tara:strand:+ start:1145 stop:1363 length:219 start_codon:yes stop_codon:yes gene_type:complete
MKILAHPLSVGGYIIYVVDHVNKPIVAEITDDKDEISPISTKLSKKYKITSAEYVEDFHLTSTKQRWKILLR